MRKLKLSFLFMFTAVVFAAALTSFTASANAMKAAQVTNSEQLDTQDELTGDLNQALDYAEVNADAFFSGFDKVMLSVKRMVLHNTDPTEAEAAALEKFVDDNQKFFEAIGVILAFNEMPEHVNAQQRQRLDAFNEKYAKGIEEIFVLMALGVDGVE